MRLIALASFVALAIIAGSLAFETARRAGHGLAAFLEQVQAAQ